MSDGGGHGEDQHDQGDVAMPAVPGAGLVVVEASSPLAISSAVPVAGGLSPQDPKWWLLATPRT